MPQLLVRNLDEEVVRQLKKRAGDHGISMEEEHRRILRQALTPNAENHAFWEHLSKFPNFDDDSIFERDRSLPDRATSQSLFSDE